MSSAYGGRVLLVDKSAWERQAVPTVREEWHAALTTDQLLLCSVTDFELLFSARDAVAYDVIERHLAGFRHIPITDTVHRAALTALRRLAHAGPLHHRVRLPDLLIAACAQDAGVGVLHYDRDFDRLADVLAFDSCWISPAGSIG